MEYFTAQTTPLGPILLSSDGDRLTGLWLEGQKYYPAARAQSNQFQNDLPIFRQTADWLAAYFVGNRPPMDALPLAPQGTEFQRLVWAKLREIPYGGTVTYGQLAREIANALGRETMSPQAVGSAVGHNQISIIIPCHRVLGADGSLTGYAGGLEKKRWLLTHEGAHSLRHGSAVPPPSEREAGDGTSLLAGRLRNLAPSLRELSPQGD
ncbi:MAG: methylated-DNA--[protein]-cysteine S-methyltransferase [Candidatus Onthomonas sp.]